MQFNYATLLYCRGYFADATTAFQQAKKAGRDTYYEVEADNLLHPQYFHPADGAGYPIFELTRADPLLERGIVLQREFHQHSAEKLYLQDAKLHPDEPDAQVAAAVGRFDEDDITAAFSHLGPARHAFPAQPDRPLPPRAAALVDGPAHAGRPRVHARAPARAEDADGARGGRVPPRARRNEDDREVSVVPSGAGARVAHPRDFDTERSHERARTRRSRAGRRARRRRSDHRRRGRRGRDAARRARDRGRDRLLLGARRTAGRGSPSSTSPPSSSRPTRCSSSCATSARSSC